MTSVSSLNAMDVTTATAVQPLDSTISNNETLCIPLNDTDDWIYRNESIETLFQMSPEYMNMSQCEIEHRVKFMCAGYRELLTFDNSHLARVIATWTLFLISAIGNSFVIYCVYARARSSHVHMIMLHFAIADLAFTFLVSPKDAIWNTTMEWYGGAVLCKVCQTCTQIGMYVSSFMLVVMALDRYSGIVLPMTNSKQRKRTKYLVGGAWILSILCALPAAYVFNLAERPYCPDQLLKQCIDFEVLEPNQLRPYNFFTMVMSFLAPMMLCVILYSLVACEITNMIKRDIIRVGRRDSSGIRGARKKTLLMTSLVTLTFLLFWGPYYAVAVHYWFFRDENGLKHAKALFILMYFHPAIHPFIYGVLMRDVRHTFKTVMLYIRKILTCSKIESNTPSTCLPPRGAGRSRYNTSYNRHSDKTSHKKASIYTPAKQTEDHGYHTDEHAGLLNGNATTPQSTDKNNKSNDSGNNARTSQQGPFRLPDNLQVCESNVGLNNNKESPAPGIDSNISATTNV